MGVDGIDMEFLTIDDLLKLRDRVAQALSNRVETERRDLEGRLARLRGIDDTHSMQSAGSIRLAKGGRVIGGRAVVAPKYRNPERPLQTWSGRGRKPRWMTAAMKAGKKLRDFKIAALFVCMPLAGQLIAYSGVFPSG